MFLFLKMLLAHLAADFVLQFEELYQLKLRSFLGQLLHVLIHGILAALLILPYLNEPIVISFIIFMVVEHLLQDLAKYYFTQKIPTQRFILFIADQFFHVAILLLIFLLPISAQIKSYPGPALFNYIYRDSAVTLFFIYFITLIFVGNYTFNSFYRTYVKPNQPLYWITAPELTWAIIERGTIAVAVLYATNPLWILASLAIGIFRFSFSPLRNLIDFTLSATYTIALSYLLKFLL